MINAPRKHHEYPEQPLRDGGRLDATEAENSRDHGDDEENQSPFQSGMLLLTNSPPIK